MSEKDQQETILMAIEHLKNQYESLQSPCIALLISRYYRLLVSFNVTKDKQKNHTRYAKYAKTWTTCYIDNRRHSRTMQLQLNDFIQPPEFNYKENSDSTSMHIKETKTDNLPRK